MLTIRGSPIKTYSPPNWSKNTIGAIPFRIKGRDPKANHSSAPFTHGPQYILPHSHCHQWICLLLHLSDTGMQWVGFSTPCVKCYPILSPGAVDPPSLRRSFPRQPLWSWTPHLSHLWLYTARMPWRSPRPRTPIRIGSKGGPGRTPESPRSPGRVRPKASIPRHSHSQGGPHP